MNTISIKKLSVVLLLQLLATGTATADKPKETITINTARVSRSLVSQWVEKYTETHTEVEIRILQNPKAEADVHFAPQGGSNEDVVQVGRYALLPVINSTNPYNGELLRHRLDEQELKAIFFQQDIPDNCKKNSAAEKLTVYSGAGRTSGASAFAARFGQTVSNLRGKRIAGDDIHLLTAIGKDSTGVTFNSLTYLFDLGSRTLKPQIALLPLDLKKEQEKVLQEGNLDQTLQLLEAEEIALIPIGGIVFSYRNSPAVRDFLRWVVNEGQQYNHAHGFLTLTDKEARRENEKLQDTLLSDNIH